MERFTGQELPKEPRIALMANDALGNFAISTPLINALHYRYPGCSIDYYGGERTSELEVASTRIVLDGRPFISWRCSVHGRPFYEVAKTAVGRVEAVGDYNLVINLETGYAYRSLAALIGKWAKVCGPCLAPDSRGDLDYPKDERGELWRDQKWVAPDLTERYPFLRSGFIAEIFIRLAYLEPAPATGLEYRLPCSVPDGDVPDVIVSTGASLTSKLWPAANWREVLTRLKTRGLSVGLVGAAPQRQADFYHSSDDESRLVSEQLVIDLRGRYTLPEVVGLLSKSKLVITIDNGILHFAAANRVPTIGLFRAGIVNLWAPPNPNLVCHVGELDASTISVEDVWRSVESLQSLRAF